MKITKEWLKKHDACGSGIKLYDEIGETDSFKILKYLVKTKSFHTAWFVHVLIEETDLHKIFDIWKNNKDLDYGETYQIIDNLLGVEQHHKYLQTSFSRHKEREKNKKKTRRINKPYKEWAEKWGATHIKQTDTFGHYFKVDKDGFGIMIKWHYDDSSDNYYVKWQAWWGNRSLKKKKIMPVPDRDVYLEAETDNAVFSAKQFSSYRMLDWIKENNDKRIELCKDNINKRLKSCKVE